jgi:hypothetical protein
MTLTNALEIAIHRKNTKRFIDADSTKITLVPNSEQFVDGTKKFIQGTPRPEQTLKIIWQGDTGMVRQIDNAQSGVRRFDFILLGEYDAVIEVGDFWRVGTQEYRIEYVYPYNDYEVKAGGVSHGHKPGG